MRRFIDAPNDMRCMQDITMKDGSGAQCGRYRKLGQFCTQHATMRAKENHECVYDNGDGVCHECADLARNALIDKLSL